MTGRDETADEQIARIEAAFPAHWPAPLSWGPHDPVLAERFQQLGDPFTPTRRAWLAEIATVLAVAALTVARITRKRWTR